MVSGTLGKERTVIQQRKYEETNKENDMCLTIWIRGETEDNINERSFLGYQQTFLQCVVPQNIHTHPMEGQWKFRGGGGLRSQNFFKESMGLNWNFQRGGRIQTKKPSMVFLTWFKKNLKRLSYKM